MDIQLILTYLIVAYAVGYVIYQFVKLFQSQNSDCGGSCGGCDFKTELKRRGIKTDIQIKDSNFTYIKK